MHGPTATLLSPSPPAGTPAAGLLPPGCLAALQQLEVLDLSQVRQHGAGGGISNSIFKGCSLSWYKPWLKPGGMSPGTWLV